MAKLRGSPRCSPDSVRKLTSRVPAGSSWRSAATPWRASKWQASGGAPSPSSVWPSCSAPSIPRPLLPLSKPAGRLQVAAAGGGSSLTVQLGGITIEVHHAGSMDDVLGPGRAPPCAAASPPCSKNRPRGWRRQCHREPRHEQLLDEVEDPDDPEPRCRCPTAAASRGPDSLGLVELPEGEPERKIDLKNGPGRDGERRPPGRLRAAEIKLTLWMWRRATGSSGAASCRQISPRRASLPRRPSRSITVALDDYGINHVMVQKISLPSRQGPGRGREVTLTLREWRALRRHPEPAPALSQDRRRAGAPTRCTRCAADAPRRWWPGQARTAHAALPPPAPAAPGRMPTFAASGRPAVRAAPPRCPAAAPGTARLLALPGHWNKPLEGAVTPRHQRGRGALRGPGWPGAGGLPGASRALLVGGRAAWLAGCLPARTARSRPAWCCRPCYRRR